MKALAKVLAVIACLLLYVLCLLLFLALFALPWPIVGWP